MSARPLLPAQPITYDSPAMRIPRLPTSSALVLLAGLLALAAAAWRASTAAPAPALADADRKEAADTVRLYLAIAAHLRGSGGDPRYAERLPADPAIVEGIQREIEYRRHGGHQDEPRLQRLEIREVRAMGAERADVRTKEYWITRDLAAPDAGARSDVVLARYLLRRDSGAWRVADWDVDEDGGAR